MNRLNLGSSQEKCFVTKETSITAVPADTAVQTPTVLTGESVGRQTVVVMCQCDPRHQGIESIIAKCGGIAYPVEGPGKAIPNSWPPGSHILIIALEDENDARGSVLATIQAFKQRRFKIVAFADGLERWALRSRCGFAVPGRRPEASLNNLNEATNNLVAKPDLPIAVRSPRT